MRMLKLELNKILFNKKSVIVLCALFIVYIAMGYSTTYFSFGGSDNYNTYVTKVEEQSGTIDETQAQQSGEAYAEVQKIYGSGEALDEYKMTNPLFKFNAEYTAFSSAVKEYYNGKPEGKQDIDNITGLVPLQNKLKELENQGLKDSYEYKRYEKQLETETNLGAPTFENVSFWNSLFSNWSGMNILLLLLFPIAYFVAPIFTQEVKTGMDNIVLCSMKGRKEIVTVKIIVAAISGVLLSVIFLAGIFIGTFASTGNMQGAGYAMRCLSSFRAAQFDFTIGGFALVVIAWIILLSIAFSMVSLLISSLLKNQAAAFGISFIVLLLGMITEIFGTGLKKALWPIVDFSFNALGDPVSIFGGIKTYNVLGNPVSYMVMGIIVLLLLSLVMILLAYHRQKKRTIK